MAFVPPLRRALGDVLAPAERCDIALTWTASGIDAVVIGDLTHAALGPLAALPGLARLSRTTSADREPELVALHNAPRIEFDGVALEPPPHAFLQATAPGEAAIRAAVIAGLGKARHVADLFAGCGTLALPLARTRQVLAVDTSEPALAALDRAARAAGLGPRLRVATRDLARRPLIGDELADFDAAIFDPPREGAAAQAAALARSAIARLVAVSCNPASFARDAALLSAGGYRLERLTPIDQFLWSPHLELVGIFVRPRAGRPPPRR
jgi:23S rRNA (uracil1939-C5)-methyltransferase